MLLALAILVLLTLGVAMLLSYSSTSLRAAKANNEKQDLRYIGANSIQTAMNWVKAVEDVGREPGYNSSDTPCAYEVPSTAGNISVRCEGAEDSGLPADLGLAPPEALLLLGTRHTQPGPQNVLNCKGWWEEFTGWFKNGVDPDDTVAFFEPSGLFKVRQGLAVLGATCDQNRTRNPKSNFQLTGDLIAAGRLEADSGWTVTSPGGVIRARAGCNGTFNPVCTTAVGTRTGLPDPGPLKHLNNKARDTDPARSDPESPSTNPTDLVEAFRPVGFNLDGSVDSAYQTTLATVRTTAYTWNPADGSLTPTATCSGSSGTIVFLPGWYRDSEVLNKYTANSAACTGVTFWFAPDPGDDGLLLTEDDRPGPYYLDFTQGSGRACGPNGLMPAKKSLWCIGGAASQNPRIVVGTPLGWTPSISAAQNPPNVGDTRPRKRVVLEQAKTIDNDLSYTWSNEAGAKKMGDGSVATYAPTCWYLFRWWCTPSVDRAIRMRAFAPKATAPPIDDVGYPKGRVYVRISYRLENGGSLDSPKVEVAAVSKQSGYKDCGTYTVGKFTGGSLQTYTFTDSQAKQLAEAAGGMCGSPDLITGYEVTLKVTGNPTNEPNSNPPKVHLDGSEIFYDAVQGASFPEPVNTGSMPAAAKSDCDPRSPGAQLILGGESHIYVADGSLEICGGPYVTNPAQHMSTGVFALPSVAPVRPSAVTADGGDGNYAVHNINNAKAIDGKPDGTGPAATIQYRSRCAVFCNDTTEGRVKLDYQYSPPAGYTIQKIQARVSYNPKNQNCTFLWDCPGAAPQLRVGGCTFDYPKNPDKGVLQATYLDQGRLYEESTGRNCMSPAQLSSGGSVIWAARALCPVWVCSPAGAGADYMDDLDGIELEITLRPANTSVARLLPSSGCVIAYPNYGGGEGRPDCAILRADMNKLSADNWTPPWQTREAEWQGRASVKGTVYVPSGAIEVDDTDVAYPLATRGIIARHLRITGYGFRQGYSGPAVKNDLDVTPTPREMTFVSCVQSDARRTAKAVCDRDQGDRILTKARVRYNLTPNTPHKATEPEVLWWSGEV